MITVGSVPSFPIKPIPASYDTARLASHGALRYSSNGGASVFRAKAVPRRGKGDQIAAEP